MISRIFPFLFFRAGVRDEQYVLYVPVQIGHRRAKVHLNVCEFFAHGKAHKYVLLALFCIFKCFFLISAPLEK